MGETRERNIVRLRIELQKLRDGFDMLLEAANSTDAYLGRTNVVSHFVLAKKVLVRIGLEDSGRRGATHRLRNEMDLDRILFYIEAVRDDYSHPEEEFKEDLLAGDFVPQHYEIPGFVKFGRGAEVYMSGCSFNGAPVYGSVNWMPGRSDPIVFGNIRPKKRSADFLPGTVTDKYGKAIHLPVDLLNGRTSIRMQIISHMVQSLCAAIDTVGLSGDLKKILLDD